ncbi:MAG: pilus assembly protein PilM [Deltaproteobacteria bacterium]|nr:MAG: pilus assembly protein PilM [Deltaproteobacteria bacterium]
MLFGKKDHLIGLDIGSRIIKAGEVVETKKGWFLKRFGAVDIPPGCIEEGQIKNKDEIAESIQQLFKSYNLRRHNVSISVGGYSVIVKRISVQKMTEEQLSSTIHFEAEQYIPFDISEVNIDFHIIGDSEHNPNQMNVLLVAAKKEMIQDYTEVVDMAGLTPCIIDVDAFALQNIYELSSGGAEDEYVALIDIGASKTSLNIICGYLSVFIRDVSLGCDQIIKKIMSMTGCSFLEAEEIKNNTESDKITQEDMQMIVSSVVADWCTEIRRALDFFYSTYPDKNISKIILSGGGANVKEFRDNLSLQTSVDVTVINPFAKIIIDNDHLDEEYLKQMAPQSAICMGLAMRRVNDK